MKYLLQSRHLATRSLPSTSCFQGAKSWSKTCLMKGAGPAGRPLSLRFQYGFSLYSARLEIR